MGGYCKSEDLVQTPVPQEYRQTDGWTDGQTDRQIDKMFRKPHLKVLNIFLGGRMVGKNRLRPKGT